MKNNVPLPNVLNFTFNLRLFLAVIFPYNPLPWFRNPPPSRPGNYCTVPKAKCEIIGIEIFRHFFINTCESSKRGNVTWCEEKGDPGLRVTRFEGRVTLRLSEIFVI